MVQNGHFWEYFFTLDYNRLWTNVSLNCPTPTVKYYTINGFSNLALKKKTAFLHLKGKVAICNPPYALHRQDLGYRFGRPFIFAEVYFFFLFALDFQDQPQSNNCIMAAMTEMHCVIAITETPKIMH